MNREELYGAIGELDEAILERSERDLRRKKGLLGLRRLLLAAACIGVLIIGIRETVDRLDLFRMGCSASAGTLVDGVYYYRERHNGLWQYTQEEGSRRIISEWVMDGWDVNTYGVYYSQGRGLYVRENESGKKRCLYKSGFWESSFIHFSLMQDGNVVVSVHNSRKKTIYQVLLDGISGEVLEQVTDVLPYPGYEELLYSEEHLQVGERQIMLVAREGTNSCDVLENGESLLKEGERVYSWMGTYYGDNYFLRFREEEENPVFVRYLVLRPDGNDSELVSAGGIPLAGTNDYLFNSLDPRVYGGYVEQEEETDHVGYNYDTVWCMEIATGEYWQLEIEGIDSADSSEKIKVLAYEMETDGELLFTCAPWSSEQMCWRIIYDEAGRPKALRLISGDIGEE